MLIEQQLVDLVLPLLAWLLIEQRHKVLLKPLDGPLLLDPNALKPSASLFCFQHSRKRLDLEYFLHILRVVPELCLLDRLPECPLNDNCLLASNSGVDIPPKGEDFILPLDSIHLCMQRLLELPAYLQTAGVPYKTAELAPIKMDAPCPAHCLTLFLQMFSDCFLNVCG